jgi:site-specific recombinase XerD
MGVKKQSKAKTGLVRRALPQKKAYALKDDHSIIAALEAWAEKTTGSLSYRREDLQRDKRSSVLNFFVFTAKHPFSIKTRDCLSWRRHLEERYKPNTVYARLSRLSSFYNWLLSDPGLGKHLRSNPVVLSRPKCPPPYQAESSKSLTDAEMNRLLSVVRKEADEGSIVGKRDYALLLLYFLSGLRRTELISLRGKDVEVTEDKLFIKYKRKGGRYTGREVADLDVIKAVEEYLTTSGRTNVLGSQRPLWTRHDRAGRDVAPLTSHAFVKNLKHYAQAAKLKGFHLHQTRHTFARIFAEDSGSMIETQEALDHANVATTRAYVQRITIKRDKFSASIKRRIKSEQ